MKKSLVFVTVFLFSFAALAQGVFVRNQRTTFTVEVRNHTPRALRCAGPAHLWYDNGEMRTHHVMFGVRPRSNFYRTYMPSENYINRISHSIWCR